MGKHTPGPWKIIDHDEEHISITDVEQMYGICRIEECASESRPIMVANANLIAAAPEMFESLEILKSEIISGNKDTEHLVTIINTALAKVGGELR